MLNSDYRDAAARDLEKADAAYGAAFKKAAMDMERLHNSRLTAIRTIQHMERYIVALANRPRDFDRQLGDSGPPQRGLRSPPFPVRRPRMPPWPGWEEARWRLAAGACWPGRPSLRWPGRWAG